VVRMLHVLLHCASDLADVQLENMPLLASVIVAALHDPVVLTRLSPLFISV
jgi:hypothetical protein